MYAPKKNGIQVCVQSLFYETFIFCEGKIHFNMYITGHSCLEMYIMNTQMMQ